MNDYPETTKALSLVVPSYNVEAFLPRCIESLLQPQCPKDIEIIIVDDGSTDGTARTADAYSAMYPEIVRVIHKKNGGYGSTINASTGLITKSISSPEGWKGAHGRYLCVIDGDDYVDHQGLVTLLECIKEHPDVDIFLYDSVVVDESGRRLDSEKIDGIEPGREINLWGQHEIQSLGIHNAAISIKALRGGRVTCHEHHYYVDSEYILKALLNCKLAYYIGCGLYCYAIGREGQSVNPEMRMKHFSEYLEIYKWICALFENNIDELPISLRRIFLNIIEGHCAGFYGYYLMKNDKQSLIAFDKEFKRDYPDVYSWCGKRGSVKFLRATKFALFGIASFIYRSMYLRHRYRA